MDEILLAFSVVDWFWDSWWELKHYCCHLNRMQWAIMSGSTCALGFLMLRGNVLKV